VDGVYDERKLILDLYESGTFERFRTLLPILHSRDMFSDGFKALLMRLDNCQNMKEVRSQIEKHAATQGDIQ
jgi:hypothetical protein